jgi:ubiquinone/menaquinone biosynthesis C-methylase UbiE
LIAAKRVGVAGKVIGIDFSAAMLARARQAAAVAGSGNLCFLQAAAEQLPLAGATVDGALVNGIFNLNPARAIIFAELARVIRPGGAVHAAELILRKPLPKDVQANETNWFA